MVSNEKITLYTRGNHNATERREQISYHINVSAAEHTAHSNEAVDEFVIYLPDIIFVQCSSIFMFTLRPLWPNGI